MEAATSPSFYNSYQRMQQNNSDTPEVIGEESFEKLQARISELEKELQKQKEAAEKGAKLLKLMWGDQFESDSLH